MVPISKIDISILASAISQWQTQSFRDLDLIVTFYNGSLSAVASIVSQWQAKLCRDLYIAVSVRNVSQTIAALASSQWQACSFSKPHLMVLAH